jgi:hypothetical protein
MQSMSENDFECFASTGVKTPNNAKLASRGYLQIVRKMVDLIGDRAADLFHATEAVTPHDTKLENGASASS